MNFVLVLYSDLLLRASCRYLRSSMAKILLKFERDTFAIVNNILGHHLFLC
jgi:capsule polysaccharide modification protein KpsS